MWPETNEKVELELAQLRRLVDSHHSLVEKVAHTEPDAIELSALSAYRHAFYTGLENIFKQIAVDVDRHRPLSDRWHSDLLRLMATSTENRSALVSEELLGKLMGYMGFRHVFRHAYTFDLKWSKMAGLVLESEQVLQEIDVACRSLLKSGDR